jgi:hypothetical protein
MNYQLESALHQAKINAAEEARQSLATFDGAVQCVAALPDPEARLAFLLMVIFDGNDPNRAALEVVEPWIQYKSKEAAKNVDISELMEE